MNILIAEDSDDKIKDLTSFLSKEFPELSLIISRSFKETVKTVLESNISFVILDMTMPTQTQTLKTRRGKSRTLAGKDVLATLQYNDLKDIKCVLFSQFSEFGSSGEVESLDEIFLNLKSSYNDYLVGCIKYNIDSKDWQRKLKEVIEKVIND